MDISEAGGQRHEKSDPKNISILHKTILVKTMKAKELKPGMIIENGLVIKTVKRIEKGDKFNGGYYRIKFLNREKRVLLGNESVNVTGDIENWMKGR